MFKRPMMIAALLVAGSSQAGTVMETVNRDLTGKKAENVMTTYAQNGQLRIESGDHDGYSVFKDDALYVINTRDKNYVVLDRDSLKKMADALSPAMKMLAQMPPEQRAQMEKMMGKEAAAAMGGGSKKEIRKTARTGSAAGYSCSFVEIVENGTVADELCVVPPGTLKGGDEIMAAAMKMSGMLQDALKDFDAPQLREMIDEQTALYSKVGGIPVLTRHFGSGKPISETTIKSSRSEAIAADKFGIPAGYSRREFMPGR